MKKFTNQQNNDESRKTSTTTFITIARAFGSIYFSVSIPFRLAFIPTFTINIHKHATLVTLDLIFNIILLIDVIHTFHRHRVYSKRKQQILPSSSNEDECFSSGNAEELTIEDEENLLLYPRLYLMISFLACAPLEYLSFIFHHHHHKAGTYNLVNYLMINRIAVILRLPFCVKDIADFLEAQAGLKSIGVQRAWMLLFAMAIGGHWCCCGFFVVGKLGAINGCDHDLTWPEDLGILQIEQLSVVDASDSHKTVKIVDGISNAYIQSLYWAYITMVSF